MTEKKRKKRSLLWRVLETLFIPSEDTEDFEIIHETTEEEADIVELSIKAMILEAAELEKKRKKPAYIC